MSPTVGSLRRLADAERLPLLVAALLLVVGVGMRAWVTDDALIAFRFADNLAAGHGPVFNPGDRVEGFSSPLFLLLLAPAALIGIDPFLVSEGLGLLAALVELVLLFRCLSELTGSPWIAAWAAGLWATDRVVTVWSTGGLETSLFGALVLGAFLVTWRPPVRPWVVVGVLVALAACRPEGVAFVALALVQLFLREWWRGTWRVAAQCALAVVVVLGVLLGLRLGYYGVPLPNTYYAKMGGLPVLEFGRLYTGAFLERLGWSTIHGIAWLPVLAVGLLSWRASPALPALGWFVCAMAAVTAMGGDYMTDFRLYRPFLGLLYLAVGAALVSRPPRVQAAVLALLTLSHGVRQVRPNPVFEDAPPPDDHKRVLTITWEKWTEFHEALLLLAEPGDALLVDWGGYRGYGHPFRVVDCTGLVSKDLDRDFYLRGERNDFGMRDAIPGHARWPEVGYMEREGFAFIFPKINEMPPSRPEIREDTLERHKGYPFLHVTVPLEGGRFFRFFTTLDADEIRRRGREHGVGLCTREPWREMECQRGVSPEDGR